MRPSVSWIAFSVIIAFIVVSVFAIDKHAELEKQRISTKLSFGVKRRKLSRRSLASDCSSVLLSSYLESRTSVSPSLPRQP